jgi:hypothetical protein
MMTQGMTENNTTDTPKSEKQESGNQDSGNQESERQANTQTSLDNNSDTVKSTLANAAKSTLGDSAKSWAGADMRKNLFSIFVPDLDVISEIEQKALGGHTNLRGIRNADGTEKTLQEMTEDELNAYRKARHSCFRAFVEFYFSQTTESDS